MRNTIKINEIFALVIQNNRSYRRDCFYRWFVENNSKQRTSELDNYFSQYNDHGTRKIQSCLTHISFNQHTQYFQFIFFYLSLFHVLVIFNKFRQNSFKLGKYATYDHAVSLIYDLQTSEIWTWWHTTFCGGRGINVI